MKKTTKPKPTAADLLTKARESLENDILRACTAFERTTGLVVFVIRHPRDDDQDGLPVRPLKPEERVTVGVVPPFVPPFRRYR